jgi:hypothetical protein
MLGGPAALREQLIDQRGAALYILPGAPLRPLDAPLLGRDAQFVVFDPQHDLISNLDAKSPSKGSGNHDSAILVHTRSGFFCHGRRRLE